MVVEKSLSGFIIISDIVDGQRIKQKYMGYSEARAIKEFKKFVKKLEKHKI